MCPTQNQKRSAYTLNDREFKQTDDPLNYSRRQCGRNYKGTNLNVSSNPVRPLDHLSVDSPCVQADSHRGGSA